MCCLFFSAGNKWALLAVREKWSKKMMNVCSAVDAVDAAAPLSWFAFWWEAEREREDHTPGNYLLLQVHYSLSHLQVRTHLHQGFGFLLHFTFVCNSSSSSDFQLPIFFVPRVNPVQLFSSLLPLYFISRDLSLPLVVSSLVVCLFPHSANQLHIALPSSFSFQSDKLKVCWWN